MIEWKQIPKFSNYSVSSTGLVKNNKTKRILRPINFTGGYLSVNLSRDGIEYRKLIHILVCQLFIGPRPKGRTIAGLYEYTPNHKDGNKKNNNSSNLEWLSRSDQTQHAIDNQLLVVAQGESHHKARLTNEQVLEIKRLYKETSIPQTKIAKQFNIKPWNVFDIVHGKSWNSVI